MLTRWEPFGSIRRRGKDVFSELTGMQQEMNRLFDDGPGTVIHGLRPFFQAFSLLKALSNSDRSRRISLTPFTILRRSPFDVILVRVLFLLPMYYFLLLRSLRALRFDEPIFRRPLRGLFFAGHGIIISNQYTIFFT